MKLMWQPFKAKIIKIKMKIERKYIMKSYQERKADVREKAIEWQLDFGNHNYSWGEIMWYGNYFERLGKRYGLLTEFRENGIC